MKNGKWILYTKNLEFSMSGFIHNLVILTAHNFTKFVLADPLALPGTALQTHNYN